MAQTLEQRLAQLRERHDICRATGRHDGSAERAAARKACDAAGASVPEWARSMRPSRAKGPKPQGLPRNQTYQARAEAASIAELRARLGWTGSTLLG